MHTSLFGIKTTWVNQEWPIVAHLQIYIQVSEGIKENLISSTGNRTLNHSRLKCVLSEQGHTGHLSHYFSSNFHSELYVSIIDYQLVVATKFLFILAKFKLCCLSNADFLFCLITIFNWYFCKILIHSC